jgi:hypothetical protein
LFPRDFLRTLVFALALLVVGFAVVMGGASLAAALGDAMLAAVLRGIGVGLVILLVIDAVLLLIALGINELGRGPPEE